MTDSASVNRTPAHRTLVHRVYRSAAIRVRIGTLGVALLRDRLGLTGLPGGHVHTPVLEFGAGNTDPTTGRITDPEFVRNRLDIVAQLREILRVAAGASGVSGASGHSSG